MREHPKVVGDKAMLAVMAALYDAGYDLYTPFGENTRVDLIAERGGELLRVQVKSGRLREGTVRFACCSTYGHHPAPALVRRPYHGEVDAFAVYCRETAVVYLIPIRDVDNDQGVAPRGPTEEQPARPRPLGRGLRDRARRY
jgi:hypothetical protein